MKKIIIISVAIIVLFFIAIIFLINNNKIETEDNKKIKVVTTLFPYYDIAKKIGREKAEVSLLLLPGVEPHSFEPKTSDFIKINNANIFIYTGDFMEPWVERIAKNISNEKIVIKTSEGIKLLEDSHKDEDNHQDEKDEDKDDHEFDPHIWLDFENIKTITEKITEALISISPEDEEYFTSNKNNYIEELTKLDNDFKEFLANCEKKEIIYSGHYAFAYLAKRYNLKHSSIVGISHDTEPTINSLISIIEKIKKEDMNYIFYEELSNPKIAEVIKKETDAEMLSLNPAENLSKEDFDKEVSFIDIMKKNLTNLRTGLNCN